MNEVVKLDRCIFGYEKKRENGLWRMGIFVQQGIESWFYIWKAHGRDRKTKCEARKASTGLVFRMITWTHPTDHWNEICL